MYVCMYACMYVCIDTHSLIKYTRSHSLSPFHPQGEEAEKKKLESMLKTAANNPHELAKIQAKQMVAKITAGH